jgi:hypothetical protein
MNLKVWLVLLVFAVAGCSGESGSPGPEGEAVSFADIVEKSEHHEGLFDVYRDEKSGETYLTIKPDQLDQEFIYHAVVTDGVVEGGTFRGAFADNKIISTLSRAADANISDAVIAVQDIVAEDEGSGTILIKADDVFLKESLQQIKGPQMPRRDSNSAH